MTIMTYPAAILRQQAKKIHNFGTPELHNLVKKLFAIMEEKDGAGLAAPQIGEPSSVFVYGFDKNKRYPDALPIAKDYVINPEIIEFSEEKEEGEEGCLSFPNRRGIVLRSKSIVFRTYDLSGNCHTKQASGFLARIIQHENDHLDGVLLIDRALRFIDKQKLKI